MFVEDFGDVVSGCECNWGEEEDEAQYRRDGGGREVLHCVFVCGERRIESA